MEPEASRVTMEHDGVKVVIECKSDEFVDCSKLYEFMEFLVRPALLGLGFSCESIENYWN